MTSNSKVINVSFNLNVQGTVLKLHKSSDLAWSAIFSMIDFHLSHMVPHSKGAENKFLKVVQRTPSVQCTVCPEKGVYEKLWFWPTLIHSFLISLDSVDL